MSTEPTHFLTLMNNGKAFSSLDGMACSYQCSDQFQFLPGHWQAKVLGFLRPEKTQAISKKVSNSKKKKKKNEWWNCGNTNTNVKQNYQESRYLFCCNYEQSSQNNQCTWLFCCNYEQLSQNNQCTWCSPLKYRRIFFQKKSFSREDKRFFGQKHYGKVVLNWRTNDHIMTRFGKRFINDKCIFQ